MWAQLINLIPFLTWVSNVDDMRRIESDPSVRRGLPDVVSQLEPANWTNWDYVHSTLAAQPLTDEEVHRLHPHSETLTLVNLVGSRFGFHQRVSVVDLDRCYRSNLCNYFAVSSQIDVHHPEFAKLTSDTNRWHDLAVSYAFARVARRVMTQRLDWESTKEFMRRFSPLSLTMRRKDNRRIVYSLFEINRANPEFNPDTIFGTGDRGREMRGCPAGDWLLHALHKISHRESELEISS